MKASKAMERCGALTRAGGTCQKSAGWGTEHVGVGTCRLHLGCTETHVRHGAREGLVRLVAGQMGAEVDVDPLEAPIIALKVARGIVVTWQKRISDNGGESTPAMDEGLRIANRDFAQVAKMAADAGVSERQIRIVERLGEQLSLMFEETLARVDGLTPAVRQALIRSYAESVASMEDHAIDGTAEDLAA